MADFCRGCTAEIFGAEYADRNDLAGLGDRIRTLCEGCGWGTFDRTGARVSNPIPPPPERPSPLPNPVIPATSMGPVAYVAMLAVTLGLILLVATALWWVTS